MSSYRNARLDTFHAGTPALARGADRLEDQLRSRLVGRVHEFRLEVRGAGLVLRGTARTYYAKQLAQHAVMDATDVPILANDIVVA